MKFKTIARVFSVLLALTLFLSFSGCMPTTTDSTGTSSGGGGSSLLSFGLPLVLIIVVFYFFMIRPESKKKKKLAEMRSSLSVGDKITTIGGMVGKVVSIKDDLITFETGEDRVRIEVTKWGISTIGKPATEEPPK
ncbi:MAG: preprotein translocase subunit YajC [Firmicutes bacterium]|nr:preprotein translocase subunit YajC [Bacillota bacterium]